MLKTDFRRGLALRDGSAVEIRGGGGGHGTRHADLPLTTDLRAGDRAVALDHVADEPGGFQRMHLLAGIAAESLGKIPENGRQYACASACRSRHNRAERGILFADGGGIRRNKPGTAELALKETRLPVDGTGTALETEPARDDTVVLQSGIDGGVHGLEHFFHVVGDPVAFRLFHKLPHG